MSLVFRIIPMTVVMGIIFFLSHKSGDSLHLPLLPGADKVAHMVAYATLAFTFIWFLGKGGVGKKALTVLWTVLFCLSYGITDEFHQSFIPHRSVSGADIVADVAGGAILSLLWLNSVWLQRKISVL